MAVVELLTFGAGLLLTVVWSYGIRMAGEVGLATVNTTMLWAVSTLAVLVLGHSALHLLWLFPVSLVLGTLSVVPPFSVISGPGRIYARACCIGLPQSLPRQDADVLLEGESLTAVEADETVTRETEDPYELAVRSKLADRIEALMAKRYSEQKIVDQLYVRSPYDEIELRAMVRAVRKVRGIPLLRDRARFEEWLERRRRP
jgi:hypothetical protein